MMKNVFSISHSLSYGEWPSPSATPGCNLFIPRRQAEGDIVVTLYVRLGGRAAGRAAYDLVQMTVSTPVDRFSLNLAYRQCLVIPRLHQLFMTLTSFSRSLCCAIYKKIRQIVSTGQISSPIRIKFYIYVVIGTNKILLTFDDLEFIFKVTVLQNIRENKINLLYRSHLFTDSLQILHIYGHRYQEDYVTFS